jgi:tight adherence protein C
MPPIDFTSYQVIIPLLAFCAAMTVGGALIVAKVARRQPLKERLLGSGEDLPETREGGSSFTLEAIGRVGKSVSGKGPSKNLRQELAQAGYHSPNAAMIYAGAKLLLFLLGLGAAALLVLSLDLRPPVKVLAALSSGAVISFVPNIVVGVQRSKRRGEIRSHLPDAIDLLEICVSAGMGLDMAWNAVSGEVRRVSAVLADEMALTNLEIHLGAQRAAAMRHMAERTGAEELSSLVATLVQSERFGTSLAEALRTFAKSLREERSQKAEEAAEKMAVKLLFPMVLFIFPAMLIVVAGPAFLKIFKMIAGSS